MSNSKQDWVECLGCAHTDKAQYVYCFFCAHGKDDMPGTVPTAMVVELSLDRSTAFTMARLLEIRQNHRLAHDYVDRRLRELIDD